MKKNYTFVKHKYGTIEYYLNGELHREGDDLPCIIFWGEEILYCENSQLIRMHNEK